MDSEFRELSIREKGLLEKLLNAATLGRDELRAQMSTLTAKQIIEDGTLDLRCESGPSVPGKDALVAEGICKDADGADIAVILHLGKGGFMTMLEIIKYDGSHIINPPSAGNLVLNCVPKFEVLGPGKYRTLGGATVIGGKEQP